MIDKNISIVYNVAIMKTVKTQRQESPIEQEARRMGYSTAFTEVERRKRENDLHEALNKAGQQYEASDALPAEASDSKRISRKQKMLLGAVALGVSIAGIASKESPDKTKESTVPYIVQPGDTAWGLGKSLEANIDRIEGNEDVRVYVDYIKEQASKDGEPGLQIGEVIQIPEAADRHLDPGYQDSPK